jgi:hypothetical protein
MIIANPRNYSQEIILCCFIYDLQFHYAIILIKSYFAIKFMNKTFEQNTKNNSQATNAINQEEDNQIHSAEEVNSLMKEENKVNKITKKVEESGKKAEDVDDDQRFIDKRENENDKKQQEGNENDKQQENQEGSGFFKKIKNLIFPKQNQVRTLDNEVGGLEAKEDKGISSKDVWDDRSEEVDKMGSTDTFNTSGMRSVVWNAKKNRLKAIKNAKRNSENAVDVLEGVKGKSKNQEGKSSKISERPITRMPLIYNSAKMPQIDNWENKSLFEKLKTLKQDNSTIHSDKFGGNKGDGGRGR